jgi:hypothetical protein
LKHLLLIKAAFWMLIIGAAVLLLPQPVWPRWAGWLTLGAGLALVAGSVMLAIRRGAAPPGDASGSPEP